MSDQYEKFEVIGAGRYSLVHEGHDHGPLDRAVAVKELGERWKDDSRRVAAFLAEARFLANLDYEHLLKVHYVDADHFLVITELVEGSLERLVAERGPMSSDRVRSVVQQVLKALNYLHHREILYGGIRPAKLLFTDRGKIKLGSFEPIENGIVPKPEAEKYVAPETLVTGFGDIGPPLDFYCLGFTALELLLGKEFDGVFPVIKGEKGMTDVGWLRWHGSEDALPPVKKLVPGVADDLSQALDAMLKKNVAERPQSALEAFEILRDVDPIPVIEGVEQSIAIDRRRRSGLTPHDEVPAVAPGSMTLATPGAVPAAHSSPAQTAPKAVPVEKPTPPAVNKEAPAARKRIQPSRRSTGRVSRGEKKRGAGGVLVKAFLMLLVPGGLGLGGWWLYTNDPYGWFGPVAGPSGETSETPEKTPPIVTSRIPVKFTFDPKEAENVSVLRNGAPLERDRNGAWPLTAGDHFLEFDSDDYRGTGIFHVDDGNNSFDVTLEKKGAVTPGEVELRFAVDPPTTRLVVDGRETPLDNGFVAIRFPDSRRGKQVSIRGTHDDYADYDSSVKLPESESGPVNHVALSPLLSVKPESANVTLDGQPLKRAEDGRFILPRKEGDWRLVVNCEGYASFDPPDVSYDFLKARRFSIELQPDVDHIYQLGKAALADNRFDEAIGHFSAVLDHDHAAFLTAFLLRGKAYHGRDGGEEDEHDAIDDLTAFLNEAGATAPDDQRAEAYLLRARIHRHEETDKAVVDYRSALALRPDPAVNGELAGLLLERAEGSLAKEDYDPAIADLEEVASLDPRRERVGTMLAEASYQRGMARLASRNLGAAKSDLDRAIALVGDRPEFLAARAECHGNLGEAQSGVDDYSHAIELSDSPPATWLTGRAAFYQRLNETDNALKDLDRAIKIAPDDPAGYAIRGRLYRHSLEDFERAISDFKDALRLGEPVWEMNIAIGESHAAFGEERGRSRDFSGAIRQFSDATRHYREMRDGMDLTGSQKAAVSAGLLAAMRRLGDCHRATRDYDKAIEQYTAAIAESNDTDAEALAQRGNSYRALENFLEAEKDLNRALAINEGDRGYRYYLAQLFMAWGEHIADDRLNVAPDERERFRQDAISKYRASIAVLESLLAEAEELTWYEQVIHAWDNLNRIDTSEENAANINAWRQKRDAFRDK